MKKAISYLLVVVMAISIFSNTTANAVVDDDEIVGVAILSELSDSVLVDFFKNEDISLPYRENDVGYWGPILKEMCAVLENNPQHEFAYGFTKMQNLATKVKAVVNKHYGINKGDQDHKDRTMGAESRGLKNSVLAGPWSNAYLLYNCYGYAIGTQELVDPGYYSNQSLTEIEDLGAIADLVVDDLRALGRVNVRQWSYAANRDLCIGETLISLRIKNGVDYHFMKYDGTDWYHKPGQTALLRYNHGTSLVILWTNEAVAFDTYYPATISYDSMICYISYGPGHSKTYTYTKNDQHIAVCINCDKSEVASCIYEKGVCRLCKHAKVGTIQPLRLEED